jgi:hypothetical protein
MILSKMQKIEIIDSFEDKIVHKKDIINKICYVTHDNSTKIFNTLRKINKIEYIFQGYYYINIEEERIKGIKQYSIFEQIAVVLNKLNIKWYFGLYTANDINKVVWQPSKKIYVINNKYSKKIKLEGQEIIFHKMKKKLIKDYKTHKTKNRIQLNISNNIKTLEDFNYFKKKVPIELRNIVKNEKQTN